MSTFDAQIEWHEPGGGRAPKGTYQTPDAYCFAAPASVCGMWFQGRHRGMNIFLAVTGLPLICIRRYQGADRVGGEVFATVPKHFTEFRAEPAQFIDAGDHLVVVGRFQGTSKRGQVLDAPFAHVWAMRNGKAVSFHNHVDHKAWTQGWAE